jgi:hypothetical protein
MRSRDPELREALDQLVRELRAGPVVVDDRLDLARRERAHPAEQLAILLVEQQLEAEEVGEGGVGESDVVERAHQGSPRRGLLATLDAWHQRRVRGGFGEAVPRRRH